MAKNFYNRIAANYDTDWSGIYLDTRCIGIRQITDHYNGLPLGSALDLAVGTGNSFLDLSGHVPIELRIGNDISSEMLKQAAGKISGSVEFICDDARNILNHIPPNSQDLVLCHYLFSYLDMHEILQKVYKILKPGGVISMMTTTKKNFIELSTGRFRLTGKIFRVGKHLSEVDTPENHDACLKILEAHTFQILNHSNYRNKVIFNSFDDVTAWSINSGWAAQYFDTGFKTKAVLGRGIFACAEVFMYPLYPIFAHSDISVVLARR